MSAVKVEIGKLRNEAELKKKEAHRLELLEKQFSDLKKYEGRWEKVVFYSVIANEQATNYDWRYNCGCCTDSTVEVWPFFETELGKVYSDPPVFRVGYKKNYRAGLRAGWDKELRQARISENIIEKIGKSFPMNENETEEPEEEDFP